MNTVLNILLVFCTAVGQFGWELSVNSCERRTVPLSPGKQWAYIWVFLESQSNVNTSQLHHLGVSQFLSKTLAKQNKVLNN